MNRTQRAEPPDEISDAALAELRDISGGDAERTGQLRDVLAGRITLRRAAAFSFYQEGLGQGLDHFKEWKRASPPER